MSALSLWWWCLCVVGKQMLHILGRWDSVISCKCSFWITTDFELSAEGEKSFLELHSPGLPSFCFRSTAKMKNAHVICTSSNPIEFHRSWISSSSCCTLTILQVSNLGRAPGALKKISSFFLLFFVFPLLRQWKEKRELGEQLQLEMV